MEKEYTQSLMEVIFVLNSLDPKYSEGVPKKFKDSIYECCDKEYKPDIDFCDDNWMNRLSEDAKILLAVIYSKYIKDINTADKISAINNITKEKTSKDVEETKEESLNYSNANLQRLNSNNDFEDSRIVSINKLSTKKTIEEEEIDYEPEKSIDDKTIKEMELSIPKFEDHVISAVEENNDTKALIVAEDVNLWQKIKRFFLRKK